MSGRTVSTCDRCTELGTRLRNPELVEFAGATRYVMVSHLIAAHGATGDPEPGCAGGALRWQKPTASARRWPPSGSAITTSATP